MTIDLDKELDDLCASRVWDREGELDREEGKRWMLGFIKRIRRDALKSLPKNRKYISCEGCSVRGVARRGELPDKWQQFGLSRFKGQKLGNWCPECSDNLCAPIPQP